MGTNTKPFVCNWVEGKGRHAKCGPFSIDFAYVQGLQKESHLPPDEHKVLLDKLDRIGGLYIYRDNIRILPYGNSDFDFLDIERRRSKSAQDWFFSYRRVFGYVAIDHKNNHALSEKAGREGFRQNQAYRDFRAVLINLFQRLAIEFFRSSAAQGETYWEKKNAFEIEAKLLAKQKKKADERRSDFSKLLEAFFAKYEAGEFEKRAEAIENHAARRLDRLITLDDDGDLAIGVRDLEKQIQGQFQTLNSEVTIAKPRGLALTKKMEKDWAAYQRIAADVRESTLIPLRKRIDHLIRQITEKRVSISQRRESAIQMLEGQRDGLVRELSTLRQAAYEASKEMQETLKDVVRVEFSQFREAVETLLVEFTRTTARNPGKLEEALSAFENEVTTIREREASLFEAIQRQMKDFTEAIKERETVEDRTGALEQRAQRLEEQLEFYSDFAQMGMGVGILQHEFEKSARNMRLAVRDLKPWADGTPGLKKVYNRLRSSFDHLDGYLKMLDPLGRRLRRSKVEITGDEIRMHIRRIFRRALDENNIELKASDAFLKRKVHCSTSALLGAFVNIVDNGIYWASNGAKGDKWIRFDADEEGFLIENSGPGIEERLKERIFDFGETMKPGGRGMGLAISKDTLLRDGFDLDLIQAGSDFNPVFKIKAFSDTQRNEANVD